MGDLRAAGVAGGAGSAGRGPLVGIASGAAEYALAIEEIRQMWLRDRHDGETVAQWMARTGRRKGWFAL